MPSDQSSSPNEMMLSAPLYRQVAQRIADRTGMAYLADRQVDFQRRLAAAAGEFGLGLDVFAAAIVSDSLTPAQWDVLADHLAVGETYFFREMRTLALLESNVLPALADRAEQEGRGLRLWSAGCCTGEEPYTLAIMLHRAGLWGRDRSCMLLASDLNPRFLERARAGGYRQWSFRGAPSWLLDYFQHEPGQIRRIVPAIRKMVRFEQLNLVHPDWPMDPYHALDLILCRNVLLYFTRDGMRDVLARLAERLAPGGWLATSPAEAAHVLDMDLLEPVRLESALLFRKSPRRKPWVCSRRGAAAVVEELRPESCLEPGLEPSLEPEPAWDADPTEPLPAVPEAPLPWEASAVRQALERGPAGLEEAMQGLERAAILDERWIGLAASLARMLADAGRLDEARRWVERALSAAPMDPGLHHLDGVIHATSGRQGAARAAWRRSLYLDPELVMTRYLLLCLEREAGNAQAVAVHGQVLLDQLKGTPVDVVAPHAEGMSAGRLRELVEQILFLE